MIKEEAIEILSDMRAEYNIFSDDEEEATRYHALSLAIQALNEQQRTGRWIYNDYGNGCGNWHCSACRKIAIVNGNENFCPNCGAEMRGEENG